MSRLIVNPSILALLLALTGYLLALLGYSQIFLIGVLRGLLAVSVLVGSSSLGSCRFDGLNGWLFVHFTYS